MRYIYYRSIVCPDSLYVCLSFSILLSIKIRDQTSLFWLILISTLTLDRTIFLLLGFCVFYFMNRSYRLVYRLLKPWMIGIIILAIFNKITTGNFFSFFIERYFKMKYIYGFPLKALLDASFSITSIEFFHTYSLYLGTIFIGIILLPLKQFPIMLTLFFSFLYLSMIDYNSDIFRSGFDVEAIVIYGCFNSVFQKSNFHKILPIFAFIYAIIGICHSITLIPNLSCSDIIFKNVLYQ